MERFQRIIICIIYNAVALLVLFAAVAGVYALANWMWRL